MSGRSGPKRKRPIAGGSSREGAARGALLLLPVAPASSAYWHQGQATLNPGQGSFWAASEQQLYASAHDQGLGPDDTLIGSGGGEGTDVLGMASGTMAASETVGGSFCRAPAGGAPYRPSRRKPQKLGCLPAQHGAAVEAPGKQPDNSFKPASAPVAPASGGHITRCRTAAQSRPGPNNASQPTGAMAGVIKSAAGTTRRPMGSVPFSSTAGRRHSPCSEKVSVYLMYLWWCTSLYLAVCPEPIHTSTLASAGC